MHQQVFFVCGIALAIADVMFLAYTSRHYLKNKLEG
jgi:hypothetical protein